jgi:hypothetical protein
MKLFTLADDFWIKAVSLFLGIMIWAAVKPTIRPGETRGEDEGRGLFSALVSTVAKKQTRSLSNLPITVRTRADDSRGFVVVPEHVTLTVRGDEEAVNGLRPEDIEIVVNLTDVVEAVNLRKTVQVRVPPAVVVDAVHPRDVEVRILAQPEAPAPAPDPNS